MNSIKSVSLLLFCAFLSGCFGAPDGSEARSSLTTQRISSARWQQLVGTYSAVINTTHMFGLTQIRTCTALTVNLSGTAETPRVVYTDHLANASQNEETFDRSRTCSNMPTGTESPATVTTHAPDTIVLSSKDSATFVLKARSDHSGFDLEMLGESGGRGNASAVLMPGIGSLTAFQAPAAGNQFTSGVNPISQGIQGFQNGLAAGAAAKARSNGRHGNVVSAVSTGSSGSGSQGVINVQHAVGYQNDSVAGSQRLVFDSGSLTSRGVYTPLANGGASISVYRNDPGASQFSIGRYYVMAGAGEISVLQKTYGSSFTFTPLRVYSGSQYSGQNIYEVHAIGR